VAVARPIRHHKGRGRKFRCAGTPQTDGARRIADVAGTRAAERPGDAAWRTGWPCASWPWRTAFRNPMNCSKSSGHTRRLNKNWFRRRQSKIWAVAPEIPIKT